jgi:urease accessory protein
MVAGIVTIMVGRKRERGATHSVTSPRLRGEHRPPSAAVLSKEERRRVAPAVSRSDPGEGDAPRVEPAESPPHPDPHPDPLPASGEREHAGANREGSALYRLMAWLSPAYPIGAFSYSGGIEQAVESGDISDAASLKRWLAAIIAAGSGFCDAVFFAHAHRAIAASDDTALRAVTELAAAFASSKERHLETTAQGRAFVEATRAAWPCAALDRLAVVWDGPVAYPVAVGVTAAGHGIAVEAALPAFLHAIAANLISAGVRLIPLGQTDGQRLLAAFEPVVATTAARALTTPLDQVGGATFRADIAGMLHETQYTRLFRS